MRFRILITLTALALAAGLLSALPASAAYGVTIDFPNSASEFFSPFGGPATITVTFDAATDPDGTFEARLRPLGGTQIHSKQFLVDPDNQSSPREVSFPWPAISSASAKTYVVAVYKGGTLQASESFLLRPPLVKITGASPNPFFPWVDDDYKDETFVHFNLLAQADAEARVFKANSAGKCCGALIRNDDIGTNLAAGSHDWMWDGRGEVAHGTAGFRPKGSYFVKIRADEGSAPPATSKPFKVRIERTYRAVATKTKPAQNYHHTSASVPIVIGGGCRVTKEPAYLKILCQGGHISVYWRWGLGESERIESASFVFEQLNAVCPPSIRHVGHTKHESSFTVHEDLAGDKGNCQLVTARITYSFPKAS